MSIRKAEIVGVCDERPERMAVAIRNFSIPSRLRLYRRARCLERTQPDLVILCPAAARHGEWTERVAAAGVNILVEKPFAASLAEADRMIAAVRATGKQLAINWPLRWCESHATAKRLIDDGLIGELIEYHYYGGNRGPLWHIADKAERTAEQVDPRKARQLVLPARAWRRLAPRLCRLWRHAWNVVHERPQTDRCCLPSPISRRLGS